jgi:hypothetical protein
MDGFDIAKKIQKVLQKTAHGEISVVIKSVNNNADKIEIKNKEKILIGNNLNPILVLNDRMENIMNSARNGKFIVEFLFDKQKITKMNILSDEEV